MANTRAKSFEKLGFGRLLLWKSSDASSAWVNVIALSYLSIYASDTLGLNVGVVQQGGQRLNQHDDHT